MMATKLQPDPPTPVTRQPDVTRIVVVGVAIFGGILLLVVAAAGAIVFGPDIVDPPPAQDVMLGKAQDSVVTVNVIGDHFKGSGSGFFVDDQGDILTNYHVIQEGWKVTVTTRSGDTFGADLVDSNPAQDVAEIRVDDNGPSLPLRQTPPKIGEVVYVLGNPGGDAPNSTAKGFVKALHKRASVGGTDYTDLGATDALVEPGNSGGPVVDRRGKVIGMITLRSETTGLGEFIPDATFATELGPWGTRQPVTFEAPAPLFKVLEWNFNGPCNPGCPVYARLLNDGGPGKATVTWVIKASDKKTSLASCAKSLTLERGDQGSVSCTVVSRALKSYFNVPYYRTVWGSVSITSEVPVPLT